MTFFTTIGHLEYQEKPLPLLLLHGRTTVPVVLLSCVNEVLSDLLHRLTLVHVDSILVHSYKLQESVSPVRKVLEYITESSHSCGGRKNKCKFHLTRCLFPRVWTFPRWCLH